MGPTCVRVAWPGVKGRCSSSQSFWERHTLGAFSQAELWELAPVASSSSPTCCPSLPLFSSHPSLCGPHCCCWLFLLPLPLFSLLPASSFFSLPLAPLLSPPSSLLPSPPPSSHPIQDILPLFCTPVPTSSLFLLFPPPLSLFSPPSLPFPPTPSLPGTSFPLLLPSQLTLPLPLPPLFFHPFILPFLFSILSTDSLWPPRGGPASSLACQDSCVAPKAHC